MPVISASKLSLPIAVLGACLLLAGNALADSRNPGKVIAGWVEKITLMDSETVLKAKLDTGAKTSSVHATDIERFEKNGKRWVRFTLHPDTNPKNNNSDTGVTVEKRVVRRVLIKSSIEDGDRRPVVMLDICFDGRLHNVEFNITDRSDLIYPVLLGRNFLDAVAVIDAEQTFQTQAHCGDAPPATAESESDTNQS